MAKIDTFDMERMQCLYENTVDYNLSESGVSPLSLDELLADDAHRERFLGEKLGYPESAGSDEIRSAIASWYPGATLENVTTMTGGAEANFITLWSLLERIDRLAFMSPNYMQGWGLGRHFGAGTDVFHLRAGDGRWELDLDELDAAVTASTKVIMICSPNNPTGAVLTADETEAVLQAARRVGAWVLSDEIYRGAEASGDTTPTLWGRYEKLVVTSGLSKAFGLPGLRLGWIVAPSDFIPELWKHRDYSTLMINRLSDRLGSMALQPARREKILERTREIIRSQLPVLDTWVKNRADYLSYVAPLAGAIAYIDYELPIESTTLVEKLRIDRSVLVVAGDQVGLGRGFRIGFGYDPEKLERGLALVGEALDELR